MPDFPDFLMPVAIGIIMLGIGLNLTFSDFRRVFVEPKAILTGLFCQLVLLPAIAFLLVWWWPISPVFKVGVIIIASAPGGTASNLVTHLLKGRVALSVSLTSFNSFIILLTIPFYVNLALNFFLKNQYDITLSLRETLINILLTVVSPVFIGNLIHEYGKKNIVSFAKKVMNYLMPILLVFIVLVAVFSGNKNPASTYFENIHLIFPLLILNVLTIGAGYLTGSKLKLAPDTNYTIAIEMGLQNSALAIFVASQIMNNDKLELVAVMYGSFSFLTTFLLAWILKNKTQFIPRY